MTNLISVEPDVVVTRLDNGRLHVDRAAPRALISADMLDELRAGNHHPDVTLDGDLLYIDAINRKVIYRIGEQVPNLFAYRMEWPD